MADWLELTASVALNLHLHAKAGTWNSLTSLGVYTRSLARIWKRLSDGSISASFKRTALDFLV